jgi:hypothetical protein
VDVEEAGGPEGIAGVQNLDLPYRVTQVQSVCGTGASVEGNRGDRRDPWPGASGATSFDHGSCPGSASVCAGLPSRVAVRNIVEAGSDIQADFFVGGMTLRRLAISVEDPPAPGLPNDGDGLAEPGETVRIRFPIQNDHVNPTGPLVARLSPESFLTLDPDSVLYPSLSGGAADSGTVVEATIGSVPDPRGVNVSMELHGAPGLVDEDSVQVLVGGRTGICEGFENTLRRWTSMALGCTGVTSGIASPGSTRPPAAPGRGTRGRSERSESTLRTRTRDS